MKIILIGLLLVILICACDAKEDESVVQDVKVSELNQIIESEIDLVIIDIRTGDEYSTGHIKGAANIDFYSSSFKGILESLDKKSPYLVYCRSGNRSSQAVEMMKELKFEHIYHLSGGILELNEEEYPLER